MCETRHIVLGRAGPDVTINVGRHPSNDIVFDSLRISRHYVVLFIRNHELFLADVGHNSNGSSMVDPGVAVVPLMPGCTYRLTGTQGEIRLSHRREPYGRLVWIARPDRPDVRAARVDLQANERDAALHGGA